MSIKINSFIEDVSPPIGSPLCHGNVKPARKIINPLTARGIIITGAGKPIVICTVDWVCISNTSHDLWRKTLAEAAGTTPDYVTVHTLHPHDAPGTDQMAEELLKEAGLSGAMFDAEFEREAVEQVGKKTKDSLNKSLPVTHISTGKAKVEKYASNRRILGEDGKVEYVRFSSCKDENIRNMSEGLIDPFVYSTVLWNEERAVASLTYYASHPQSFYKTGAVTYDTVGLARDLRESVLPEATHLHFIGAGGNIGAGKYNDGSPKMRYILAERLADGMARAFEESDKVPLSSEELSWQVKSVDLPINPQLTDSLAEFKAILADPEKTINERIFAARKICNVELNKKGRKFDISCLKAGPASILHMPGELFVEYQLAAQDMCTDKLVCMAAYGDCGPAYIGTEKSYKEGGYECGPNTARVAPEIEQVLMQTMRELLN